MHRLRFSQGDTASNDSVDRAHPRSTLRSIPTPEHTREVASPGSSMAFRAPAFRVIEQQPLRPAARVLAILIAAGMAFGISEGLQHSKARQSAEDKPVASRTAGSSPTEPEKPDKDDDPSQVDTIVLGDAADAPVPARRNHHVSDVHATVIVHLPRYGPEEGLIPDSPAGHLLFAWLAAFNQGSDAALAKALPNVATNSSAAAQMVLRAHTGGFRLLSAREVQPGVLVFRLRDQTPELTEVLGTLQVRPGSNPASIGTFSLRAVIPDKPVATRK